MEALGDSCGLHLVWVMGLGLELALELGLELGFELGLGLGLELELRLEFGLESANSADMQPGSSPDDLVRQARWVKPVMLANVCRPAQPASD